MSLLDSVKITHDALVAACDGQYEQAIKVLKVLPRHTFDNHCEACRLLDFLADFIEQADGTRPNIDPPYRETRKQ